MPILGEFNINPMVPIVTPITPISIISYIQYPIKSSIISIISLLLQFPIPMMLKFPKYIQVSYEKSDSWSNSQWNLRTSQKHPHILDR